MLTDRQKDVLQLIISLYGEERTPVGSKSLLELVGTSSATIRNEMKTLEDLGLIRKEHTSSGRVPSVDGYKYYLSHLIPREKANQEQVYEIMHAFEGDFYKLEDLFKRAADILSSRTSLSSFLLNIPQRNQRLRGFDVVKIDAHSILGVFTLSTGEVKTSQLVLPRSLGDSDLEKLRVLATERFVGKELIEIHYNLRTEIPQILGHYFTATSAALQLIERLFADLFEEKIVVSGRQHIFNYVGDEASKYYRLLSDEALVAQEIRKLTQGDELSAVKFDNSQLLQSMSLISQKFVIPYRGLGTMALIGPIEMNYQEVMQTIDLVAKVLTMKLMDYYRYLDGNHYEIK